MSDLTPVTADRKPDKLPTTVDGAPMDFVAPGPITAEEEADEDEEEDEDEGDESDAESNETEEDVTFESDFQ